METKNHNISREEFLAIRKHYIDTSQKSTSLFDHTLITLSTGSLGGSIYLITSHYELFNHCKCLLFIGRISLGITVAITLYSFKISSDVNIITIFKRDKEYTITNDEDGKKIQKEVDNLQEEINKKNKVLGDIQDISILLLVIGILFIGLFLIFNYI